jgi:hypothetical protein
LNRTLQSRLKGIFNAKQVSVKVSVKHKPTAGKKFQTLLEMSVKCVNIPCKYVVFESESHPFRQFLHWFYEFPQNRKTQKWCFLPDKHLTKIKLFCLFKTPRISNTVLAAEVLLGIAKVRQSFP